ncbi:MAG TPA: 50S ribosomal protein L9 [Armatimonadota bacterium]|nr:50S ribosomal protein L9 [Armatimonadota bacterium]
MKVILAREVKGLGLHDDIVNVSDGYARNYLFPRGLAVAATKPNLAELEKRRKIEEARGEKTVGEAKDLAERLAEVQITIKGKVGTGTKLYGAITHADIADELEKQTGIKIDKRKIELEEPIKSLGTYDVPVRLHRDAVTHLKLEVLAESEDSTQ